MIVASVATRLEKNPLVEVALEAMRLVVDALVIVAFVVVEFPTISELMVASVAMREEMKELVEVALVLVKLVMVPVTVFKILATKLEEVVVAKLVAPVKVLSPAKV